METATLKMPQRIYLGDNLLNELSSFIKGLDNQKVLIFTDKGLLDSGLVDPIINKFKKEHIIYEVENEIKPEPTYIQVDELKKKVSKFDFGSIVAIGGGSVMDAAKLISLIYKTNLSIKDLIDGTSKPQKHCETILIPTTTGTGSEATINAIVTIPEKEVKFGIVSDEMLPDLVLLDTNNVKNLPKAILAASAVDALSHCVECYTSKNATPLSNGFAALGAKYIFENILEAYRNENNIEARRSLLLGAFYGGVAITASGTTAVHALSYPLGGKFHIAHGVSNAILFKEVMKVNKPDIKDQLASLCDFIYPELKNKDADEKADIMLRKINQIVTDVEIPTNLTNYGVTADDLDFLVNAALQQTRLLEHNRRALTKVEIENIYKSIL
ncbi:iron-containing alcohol dehydrogenase [Pediococcus acidilactici]|uniref:iron-containing alcohol dehydrogenase n=1 Tax=Pediococcus acidilactici TaxID=1254 RepID=UPI001C70A076|nr:iron-containing alcohol dehydrogenase [Pediococcus acidilactici]MBW9301011.1 iron-containing alcohol dehydrogenase [Pediococcus acidilactici]